MTLSVFADIILGVLLFGIAGGLVWGLFRGLDRIYEALKKRQQEPRVVEQQDCDCEDHAETYRAERTAAALTGMAMLAAAEESVAAGHFDESGKEFRRLRMDEIDRNLREDPDFADIDWENDFDEDGQYIGDERQREDDSDGYSSQTHDEDDRDDDFFYEPPSRYRESYSGGWTDDD